MLVLTKCLSLPDPEGRPLSLSVFNAEFTPFRKQYLLYDMFMAKSITGIFDGCLFKYGTPQRIETPSESSKLWKEVSFHMDSAEYNTLQLRKH